MIQPAGNQVNCPRGRFDADVLQNQPICREHYRLRLGIRGDFPATNPGHFIQLGCRTPDVSQFADHNQVWDPGQIPDLHQPELCGPLALLRRPFSLSGRNTSGGDQWIEVIHRVVGVGTQWLADLRQGDRVDLIGPLGNTFSLPPDKSNALLVGGGVGLPPMFYLAEALHDAGWSATGFVGAQSRDLLAVTLKDNQAQQYARFGFDSVITTDDGSAGIKGLITDGLVEKLNAMSPADAARTVIYTCGPHPMMHAVARLAADHNIDCQVCLEQAMACGMGTCQSCIVRIHEDAQPHGATPAGRPWRYRLACTDGPVFDATQVIW